VVAFDNLSHLSSEASNAFCRLTTGGSFVTRKLYTDDEEAIFQATRAVIINGIEEVVIRGDLLDRSLLLHLPTLSPTQRREEIQVWREFDDARPRILGALLDAVSGALRDLETVTLTERPRMADFAQWACAAAPALGWSAEQFLHAYTRNIQSANDLVLDASPVAQAVLKFMEQQRCWEGTATQLLAVLQPYLEGLSRQECPRSGQILSNDLRRLEPHLSQAGVHITFHRKAGGKRDRLMTLERVVPHDIEPSTAKS
jgi:putative DNA primase/helicase